MALLRESGPKSWAMWRTLHCEMGWVLSPRITWNSIDVYWPLSGPWGRDPGARCSWVQTLLLLVTTSHGQGASQASVPPLLNNYLDGVVIKTRQIGIPQCHGPNEFSLSVRDFGLHEELKSFLVWQDFSFDPKWYIYSPWSPGTTFYQLYWDPWLRQAL